MQDLLFLVCQWDLLVWKVQENIAIGFQGLAQYWFEVDSALFVGESGQTNLRLAAEYEWMFTQKLVLSPEIEVNFHGKNDQQTGTGSGLSDSQLGLRLRYEINVSLLPILVSI